MGCFRGCRNNCCGNCNGNGDDNDNGVESCAEEVRRAYWAGYRDGCNDPRCHHHHDYDDDCR